MAKVKLEASFIHLLSVCYYLVNRPLRPVAAAKHYVGTNGVSGQIQLELLKKEGCLAKSKVLEIGCGCLNAGTLIITYLEKGNYVGIDPNVWLREAAMRQDTTRRLVYEKQARFLSVDDFDASVSGLKFDYVFSHSILSHCAHWQLDQFLTNTGKVLAPHGRILASIYLAEGNAYGSKGSANKQNSMDEKWQYPGCSSFTLQTVIENAKRHGLTATYKPEYTEFYTKRRPTEAHDWIVFAALESA